MSKEFYPALRADHESKAFFTIDPKNLDLMPLGGHEIGIRLGKDYYPLEHGLPSLFDHAGLTKEYADKLFSRKSTALLCACLIEALRAESGALRVSLGGGKARICSGGTTTLMSPVEVFAAAEHQASRFGYGLESARILPSGAQGVYVLPEQAFELPEGAGAVLPALQIVYMYEVGVPIVPIFLHGFVLRGSTRMVGEQLAGTRKLKPLKQLNQSIADLIGLVRIGDVVTRDELAPVMEHAFAFDSAKYHAGPLSAAITRPFLGDAAKALPKLMGDEFDKSLLSGAPPKNQLELAFMACHEEYAITSSPYKILTLDDQGWNKALGIKKAAAAAGGQEG